MVIFSLFVDAHLIVELADLYYCCLEHILFLKSFYAFICQLEHIFKQTTRTQLISKVRKQYH
ncbi:hypothetical protein GLYMA_07G121151v4 [Glycine max]|nr:hypothetical protein GLYMA_07G121151v4 [Glycine max]KAH1086508.1 hypothetical protein GYH30_018161 [Glycine max]